jgi:protein-tyrosine sulfotransferase
VVGGCHRSGPSLVRRILDAHPRIHCGPELTFFRDFYGDFRDDPLAHLRFSRTARAVVPEEEALDVLGRALVELHERAAATAGKVRWADKAPENVLYAANWERLLEGRFLFVHVVRNPLDTIASMVGRFPLTLPDTTDERIDLYRRYTGAGLDYCADHPGRSVRLLYEELCGAPAETLARLMEALAEDPDPAQLAFNELPHQEGLEDPEVATTGFVHGLSVGRWSTVLTDDEAAHVWDRTRDLWARADDGDTYTPLVRGSS